MRRGSHRNEQLGNIWDVVSNLALALTDARDQLIDLINFPSIGSDRNVNRFTIANGFPHQNGKENINHNNKGLEDFHEGNALARTRGGGPSAKKFSVPGSNQVRSIHRQHARGHVAFGAHSEFKPQPPCNCRPINKGTGMGSSMGSRRKQGSGKKGVQIGLFLDPKSNCLQIDTKKGMGNPVNIKFLPNEPNPDENTCKEDPACRPSSSDKKRHCIGTQYAALLKEEAFRIRDLRLAEDQKAANSRPKWTRC